MTNVDTNAVRTQASNEVDASIIRNFLLGGSRSLQFRLEAFNLFNKPIWGGPLRPFLGRC